MPSLHLDKKSKERCDDVDWDSYSDRDIYFYSNLVMTALESKADFYRILRKSSTTVGVTAALFGAGLHGAFNSDEDTLTMVAGVATIMPLLQRIWKTGEASKAQEKGADLIRKARSRFEDSIGGEIGKIDGTRITRHGSTLSREVSAALSVVRAAVAQTIPSLDDLKTAMGEAVDNSKIIKVVPEKLNMMTGTTAILSVINGYAVNAVSSDNSAVTVEAAPSIDSPKKTISISATSTAPATIMIIGSSGGVANVNVNVNNVAAGKHEVSKRIINSERELSFKEPLK